MTLADRLEALDAAATPRPWRATEGDRAVRHIHMTLYRVGENRTGKGDQNPPLVAELRNHTSQIIRALRLLERANADISAAIARYDADAQTGCSQGWSDGRMCSDHEPGDRMEWCDPCFYREWLHDYRALAAEMGER